MAKPASSPFSAVPHWLLDALPDAPTEARENDKQRGVYVAQAIHVYAVMARACNYKTKRLATTNEALAESCGLSTRSLYRVLRALIAVGAVERATNRAHVTVYHLLGQPGSAPPGADRDAGSAPQGADQCAPGGAPARAGDEQVFKKSLQEDAASGVGGVPSEDQSQDQEREPLQHPLGGGTSQRVGGRAGSHVPPIVEKSNDSAPLRYRDAASVAGSREVSPVTKESQLHETDQVRRRKARPAGARTSRPPQGTPSPAGRPAGGWLTAGEKRQKAYSDFKDRLRDLPPPKGAA